MRNVIYATIAVLVLNGVNAQEKRVFTLSEAKAYTLENHLALKSSDLDLQSAEFKRNETRAIGFPKMELEGTFNNFLNLPVQVVDASFINPNAAPGETVSFRAGTDFSAAGSFKASQILFNGSYLVGLQVSKQYVDFQHILANQNREEIIFSVIKAYNLVAVAKDNLIYVDSLVMITEKLVEKQKNYLELGLMKAEEMDQLQYAFLTAQNAKSGAEIQYKNSLTLLKLTMNYPMQKSIEVSESSDNLMNLYQVEIGSLKNNRALMVLEGQMSLNEYALKNEKFANLPSLNAFFQHSYNAYRNEFDFFANDQWFKQTFWGLQLNVPVFAGGQRHYKIQQAKVELMKNQNAIAQLELSLQAQEIQAMNNLEAARNQYDLQQSNVNLADKIYRNAAIRSEVGSESSIVVTQKYNQLIHAQSQLTASKIDYFNAKLELEKLYNRILKNQ